MGGDTRTTAGAADFAVAISDLPSAVVVSVSGEVDVETAPRLRSVLFSAVESRPDVLVVDLSEVSFLDSTGLGVLVAGLKRAREHDGDLRLVVTASPILRVLAVTRLDLVFAVHPTVEDALK